LPLLPFSQQCLCCVQEAGQTWPHTLKKEEITMALSICWLDDLAKAKNHALQTKKPILLDFFNPQ
jgi:hypothetical protein